MRKTKTVTIESENRDHGKCFLLTEMSAAAAEKWAARAFLALAKSGVNLPDGVADMGLAGVAAAGAGASDLGACFGALVWALALAAAWSCRPSSATAASRIMAT